MRSNHYETTFILNPQLSDANVTAAIKKIKDLMKKEGVAIIAEHKLGHQTLAYPIQKQTKGIYHTLEFQAPSNFITILETTYKRDEQFIRFLTIALNQHGIAYNESKRQQTTQQAPNSTPQTL